MLTSSSRSSSSATGARCRRRRRRRCRPSTWFAFFANQVHEFEPPRPPTNSRTWFRRWKNAAEPGSVVAPEPGPLLLLRDDLRRPDRAEVVDRRVARRERWEPVAVLDRREDRRRVVLLAVDDERVLH